MSGRDRACQTITGRKRGNAAQPDSRALTRERLRCWRSRMRVSGVIMHPTLTTGAGNGKHRKKIDRNGLKAFMGPSCQACLSGNCNFYCAKVAVSEGMLAGDPGFADSSGYRVVGACPRWRQSPRHGFLHGPLGRHRVCRACEVDDFPSAGPRTLSHHRRSFSRYSRPQGWNAPMKIAGSTRASFRLTFQCMCGPVARPVEPTRPTTSPRRRSWPFFTSMRDRWQNMLMNPWP